MTPSCPRAPHNLAKSRAALALHNAGRVKALALVAALAVAGSAHAQTPGIGSCTGGMLAGTVGLARYINNTTRESIQSGFVTTAFGNADCRCDPTGLDALYLDIMLTATLPQTAVGTVQVWVGSGCDNPMTRTAVNQTQCEQLTDVPPFSSFTQGGSASHIYIPISARALMSPITHQCTLPTTSNSVFVFLFSAPNDNPSAMDYARCTLSLSEANQGPSAPFNASAGSGDGAVTLNWSNPVTLAPTFYQILCADQNGMPVPGKGGDQIYSTCLDTGIKRRDLPTGGSTGTGTTGQDMGGTVVQDMAVGTMSAPLGTASVPGSQPAPQPRAADDGGTTDGGTSTGIGPTDSGLPFPFTDLNPAYICSGQLGAQTTSQRITGLTNGQPYQFVILGVDQNGNATSNGSVLVATPQPVEDLYRRYRDSGGKASGFCFIATAAFGSYESRWVHVLRDFRDEVLLPTRAGAAFVAWYYAHSPGPAQYIAEHRGARIATQLALWPVIGLSALWLYTAAWQKALACALLFALWAARLRRRRARRRSLA
jgi:hypothetical protein